MVKKWIRRWLGITETDRHLADLLQDVSRIPHTYGLVERLDIFRKPIKVIELRERQRALADYLKIEWRPESTKPGYYVKRSKQKKEKRGDGDTNANG
jgi:hypothetical protein